VVTMMGDGPSRGAFGRARRPFRDDDVVRMELHLPGSIVRRMHKQSLRQRRPLSSIAVEALDDYLDPDEPGSE
jgi:hypothetical protein